MGLLQRYRESFARSFSTGAAVQNQWIQLGDSGESWSNTKYGEYVATSSGIYIAANYRAKIVGSVPLALYRGAGEKRTEIERGSLFDLTHKINPHWTFRRLMQMTEMSLCLWGSSYWFLERGTSGTGEPAEIWWARPDRVKVVPHPRNYVSHFEYDVGLSEPLKFSREETIWIRYPNPLDEFSGLSPLAAARIAADTSMSAMRSNNQIFTNGLQMAGFVAPESNGVITDEQGKQIEDSLRNRFTGRDKAHRWAVLRTGLKFTPLNITPKDAEYLGMLDWSFKEICRVYGLNPDLLGGDSTFSNAKEARLQLWEDTIKPELNFIADELTEQLLPLFKNQADVAEFDLSQVQALQEAEDAKWDRWSDKISKGAVLVNEYRKGRGEDAVAWGDDWYAPSSLVPIGGPMSEAKAQADAEAAAQMAEQLQAQQDKPATDQPAEQDVDPNEPRQFTRSIEYGGPEHQRLWDAHVRRMDPHEKLFGDMCGRLMKDQRKSILAKLNKREADPVDDILSEADLKRWKKRFREESRPVLREIVADAGEVAMADVGLSLAFDVHEPNVVRFLEQRAQRFAVEVNETTWTNLKGSLAEGIEAGESIPELAQRVENVMGDRIRSSGTTIARTEVIGASNGGTQLSWEQSGVVAGKEWLAAIDERTRETHVEAHGQQVRLDADFSVGDGSGPQPGQIGLAEEDINCRCTSVAILDIDWRGE